MKKLFSFLLLGGMFTLLCMQVVLAQEAEAEAQAPTEAQMPTTSDILASIGLSESGIPPQALYYIGGLLIFFIIYFVVMKFVKNKMGNHRAGQAMMFAQKSPEEQQALLDYLFEKEGLLHQFQTIVKGEKIAGIRQCFPYKTIGGAAKEGAKTLGKQMLRSAVGVKATYVDVGRYYLVLTDKSLHYLAFDKHHEIAVQDSFPLSQIMDIHFRSVGTKDLMRNSDAHGNEVIEFECGGEKISFIYYLQNLDFPGIELKTYQKALMDHHEAFLYIDVMFKKHLEEKAGTVHG